MPRNAKATGSQTGAATSPVEEIVAWLQSLPANGKDGFEGLIVGLFEKLSGYRFHLARSGSQFGRDAGTHDGLPSIALETKRYSGKLSSRELHGELEEVHQRTPELELWVLTTTTAVSDQLRQELERNAQNRGIAVEILDLPVGSDTPELVHLCAAHPALLERFRGGSEKSFPEAAFAAVGKEADHSSSVAHLKERIRPSGWGFVPAREAVAKRLHAALGCKKKSARTFGQRLAPWEAPSQFVGRSAASQGLDRWWANGTSGSTRMAALIGEEGCGKSWLAAAWVDQTAQGDAAPLVIWCGSSTLDLATLRKSFREALVELATDQVTKEDLPGPRESWKRRVGRWLGAADGAPKILLILDGLNELADAATWRLCLEQIREEISERKLAVAVLCTSRKAFWKRCEPGKEKDQVQPAVVELEDFTDDELRQALEAAGRPELLAQKELKELLRKPRYFGLALRHAEVMQADADYSRARLFFEDFRERTGGRDGYPLTGVEFNQLLMKLAATAKGAIGASELGGTLTDHHHLARALEELQSSGVLSPVPADPGHFKVNPQRPECLWLGLGLLLLKEIAAAQAESSEALEELLASKLEPAAELDQKADICAYALMVGFLERGAHGVSDDVLIALLKLLAEHQNGMEAWVQMKPWLYFSARPEVFERFTEEAWQRRSSRSHSRIEYLFAEIASLRPIPEDLITLCEKWMGWVSLARIRARGRFQPSVEKPEFSIGEETLRAVERSTSITRLVWQIIAASEYECASFVGVFRRWAVASAAEGEFPDIRAVRWLLRLSKQDLGPAIREWAERITEDGDAILLEAAYWLLHAEGSEESWRQRDRLRSKRRRPDVIDGAEGEEIKGADAPMVVARRIGREALDPACQIEPSTLEMLQNARLNIELPDTGQTCSGDLDLEAIEPVMAAFAPAVLADFWVRTIGNSLVKSEDYLKRLPLQLEDCFLLLTPELIERVSELQRRVDGRKELELQTEEVLAGVLIASKQSAEDQRAFIVQRINQFDNREWTYLVSQGPRTFVMRLVKDLESASGIQYLRIWWLLAHQDLAGIPLVADELFREVRRHSDEKEPLGTAAWLLEKAQSPELLETAWKRRRLGPADLVPFFEDCGWAHPLLLKLNEEKPFEDLALKSWIAQLQGRNSQFATELADHLEAYWERPSIAGETLYSTEPCADSIRAATLCANVT